MFAVIFIFAIITIHVKAEISSYIHVCGLNDPNYNQCIADSISHVKNKICTGFPEFNISPNEPVFFDKMVIFDTDSIKLYLRNVKMYKICDFNVKSVYTDSERRHFDIHLLFPQLYFNATYDFDIRLLIPIANKGLVEITTDNLPWKVGLDLKVITKHGKKQIFASKVNTIIDLKSFKYKFNENEKELVQLHEILDDVVAKNKKDIIRITKTIVEEKFSKIIISIFNNLTRSNYEKLFPETI